MEGRAMVVMMMVAVVVVVAAVAAAAAAACVPVLTVPLAYYLSIPISII